MNAITTIDKAGRLIVPKSMRDALHLRPGDSVELKETPEGLLMRPKAEGTQMKKKGRFWVLSGGDEPLTNDTVNQVLRQGREEREKRAMGFE